MALFLSLLSFGCFAGAGATFLQYDGRYFDLLIICAVVLLAAAEIISAIRNAGPGARSADLESADAVRELKEINDRLVKVQLAIERLDRPSQL
jgi:hypothetical protein